MKAGHASGRGFLSHGLRILIFIAVVMSGYDTAFADVTWTKGSSGNWSGGINWSSSPNYPNSNTTSVGILDGTSNVTLDTNVSVASLQLASGNTLTQNTGTQLAVYGPSIVNEGQIVMNGGGGSNAYLFLNGDTTLSGTGALTLNQTISGSGSVLLYNNAGGTKTLTNQSTIQGDGTIGSGTGLIINNSGTINANSLGGSYATTLTVNNVGGITNTGLLTATNHGVLLLSSQIINNQGGNITADGPSATVQIQNSTVQGGTLNAVNGGTLQSLGSLSTLDGSTHGAMTLNGTYTVTGGSQTTILGTINNNNNIQLNGGNGNNAYLLLGGTTTLQGGGTVTLNTIAASNGNSFLYNNASGVTLTNVDNTIQGSGYLGYNQSMTLVNQAGGVISANSTGGPLTTVLQVSPGGGITNQGLMEARNSGTLQITGNTVNNTGGNITVANSGATVQFDGSVVVQGGTLTNNGGTMQTVGHSTLDGSTHGAITLNGTYTVTGNSQTTLLGTINNNNNIQVNGGNGLNAYLFFGGTTTLQGGGTVTLNTIAASNGNSFLYNNTSGATLTNVNNTIQGSGYLGYNQNMTLVNQAGGVISANSTGGPLTTVLQVSDSGGITNQGLMEARNSGTLQITGTTLNNTGGNITVANSGATVQFDGSAVVQGGTLTNNGGTMQTVGQSTLDGSTHGDLTLNGAYTVTGGSQTTLRGTLYNNGNIQVNGGGGYTTYLFLGSNTDLRGSGTVTLDTAAGTGTVYFYNSASAVTLTNVNNTIQGSGYLGYNQNMTLVNQAGGVITANVTGRTLTVNPAGGLANAGTLQAANGGTLTFTGGSTTTNQSGGVVEARANSSIVFQSGATVTNLSGGTLTGGIWRANSVGGSSALVDFQSNNTTVATNSADIWLIGANSSIQGRNAGGTVQSLDQTLSTNSSSGNLYLQQGRTFNATANSGNFTNNGVISLNNGTFQSNTLGNNYYILSDGNSTVTTTSQMTGTGTVAASGTLTITSGVNMGNSSSRIEINQGGTIDLHNAAAGSKIGTIFMNTGSYLNLGSQDINVHSYYTNGNVGYGNNYNNHGNVSGSGQIIGVGASQAITGDVTNGTTTTVTMDFGNVRGGTSTKQLNYDIRNTGNGAYISGAIQDNSVNGGHITDSRLGGSGVTAKNFGITPIDIGPGLGYSNTYGSMLGVHFTPSSGGALTGQSVAIVSNFDNIPTQVINFTGAASALAVGDATPKNNPVNLGNFHVNGTQPTQAFAVANNTPANGIYTERLGIASVGKTGNFSVANNLGSGFIDGGATLANAVSAQVSNGLVGVNTGSVTIQYTTNGQLLDSNFTTINANSQTINLQATGYNLAVGNVTPTPIILANQRVNGGLMQALTVANTAPVNATYTETLSSGFGTNTDNATNNGGTVSAIAGGGSNNSAMLVGIDTTAAGARTGTVTVNLTSNAVNSSGLGNTVLTPQQIAVSGNVYQVAQPSIQGSLNLGNVHVGGAASQAIAISNTNVAPGYQEGLNAGVGATSNATGLGSITNLAAGAPGSTNISLGMTAATAGVNTGSVTLSLATNGTGTSGLPTLALTDKTVTTSITGYNLAQATINNPSDFNLGNILLSNGPVTKTVSITNSAPAGIYSEALNAAFGTITNNGVGNVSTNSGAINGLLAGSTDALTMQVTYTPTTQGSINASVKLVLNSNGDAIGNGLGTTPLPDQSLTLLGTVTGTVGTLAQAGRATPNPVNLGNVRVNGSAPSQTLSIQNTATAPAEGLNASIATSTPGLTASGSFTSLAPQAINNTSLVVGMGNTATAGSRNGTATITLASDGTFNGGITTSLGTQTIGVTGGVYQVAQPNLPTSVNLGNVRIGNNTSQAITVNNSNISPAGYQEGLNAGVGATSNATGLGSITNLAAGAPGNTNISLGMTAAAAGVNTGSVTLSLATNGTGTSGLPTLALADQTVSTSITGYRLANPTVTTTSVTIAARVGDPVSANHGISITNTSPDIYTEGLKVTVGTVSGNAQSNGGTIANLAAQGNNNTAVAVGLGSTAIAGTSSGSVALNLFSTGAGTTGASDYSLPSQTVTVNGKVYTPAVASVGTVNFGTVHVGDTPTRQITVQNTAAATALNDVLGGTLGVSGPFTGGGSINAGTSGLSAGGTKDFTVGLNAASAGTVNGTATFSGVSHNSDMSDMALAEVHAAISAQVNNFAVAKLDFGAGAGTFIQTGSTYTLDFGTLMQNSGTLNSTLFAENGASGPADLLSGNFQFMDNKDFGENGFDPFSGLAAGDKTGAMTLAFDTTILGTFSDIITLHSWGSNDSDYDGALGDITLNITGHVVEQGSTVPEPGTLLLVGIGLAALGAVRKRIKG